MTNRRDIYKCEQCGITTIVLIDGEGALNCCSIPMVKIGENTVEATKKKHIPIVEKIDEGYKIKVGSVPHPMEKDHYIQWIELVSKDKSYFEFLNSGGTPETVFNSKIDDVYVRTYCNLHGLWRS